MRRPSYKELYQKIKQAKEAVLENRVSLLNSTVIISDTLELGFIIEELFSVLVDFLEEIRPKDYVGKYPPERSYEDKIYQCELFPFRWVSKRFGCTIYLKFVFKEDHLWLVSLHQDRKGREGE